MPLSSSELYSHINLTPDCLSCCDYILFLWKTIKDNNKCRCSDFGRCCYIYSPCSYSATQTYDYYDDDSFDYDDGVDDYDDDYDYQHHFYTLLLPSLQLVVMLRSDTLIASPPLPSLPLQKLPRGRS